MLHDEAFLATHRGVSSHVFPKGCLQYLVALALRLGSTLQEPVVRAMVESDRDALRRHGAEAQLAIDVFRALNGYAVEDDSLTTMRELASTWLGRRSLKVGIDEAISALESSDYDRARALLSAAQYTADEHEEPLDLLSMADYILAESRWSWQDAVPTGLYDLDRAFKGGARGGDVGIIMGHTGLGKTMWACLFAARAFWAGRPVLYYTTELTKGQIATRIALGILESGLDDLPKGVPFSDLLIRASKNQGYEVGERSNIEVRYAEGSVRDIGTDVERYKEQRGYYPGFVIIDSPIDMTPPVKVDKDYLGHRASFVYLRKLGRHIGAPIWTTAQVNREGMEKPRVRLKDMADAAAMAQKAHYVLGLAQTQEQRDETPRTMTMYILKDSNHGQTGGQLLLEPHFGSGDNGFPGARVAGQQGLRLPVRKE